MPAAHEAATIPAMSAANMPADSAARHSAIQADCAGSVPPWDASV